MRYGMTELREKEILEEEIPELFLSPKYSPHMLYIGANQVRPPHHSNTFAEFGWTVHLLEVFLDNVIHHHDEDLFSSFTWGSIVNTRLKHDSFDVVFWWHGPEHVKKESLGECLDNAEHMASEYVVLGCPNGNSPQGEVYGNYWERHRWSVTPADLEAYGYQTRTYDAKHLSHILAWKRVGYE